MTVPIDLNEITTLMPMPVSNVRLAEMVSEPSSTIKDFARVIELDQALTANVLRWANSSASHPAEKITTVRRAVVRLGAANILKLTMGQHVLASFGNWTPGGDLAENELWRHGVAAAMCAEQLGEMTSAPIPGIAFTAALLHDVGKLLLGRKVGYGTLTDLIASVQKESALSSLEAEREILKTDHAETGAAMARKWHFPDALVSAIENHHAPNEKGDLLLDVIIIANGVAKIIRAESGAGDMQNAEALSASLRRLGLNEEKFALLGPKIAQEIGRSESLWRV